MRLDRDVATVATLIVNPPSFDSIILDADLKQEIAELFRVAVKSAKTATTTPVVVLAGLEGSGRKALAFGAAEANGSAALHVRCSALPNDAQELRRLSRSIIREAILHHAVPIFEGLDELAAKKRD